MAPSERLFDGTAAYYAQYRPGLLEALKRLLLESVSDAHQPRRLLDLGAGTGQVGLALGSEFDEIIAVEPNAEMARLARSAWPEMMVIEATAEEVSLPEAWTASLVTLGRSFHWMDQPKVLRRLEGWVEPNGLVAIFGEPSLWNGKTDWQRVVKQTIQQFLGVQRRAGGGVYREVAQPYRKVLEATSFRNVRELSLPFERTWTFVELLGLLYSTSFSARQLYGSRVGEFEEALKQALQGLGRTSFMENSAVEVILARRA